MADHRINSLVLDALVDSGLLVDDAQVVEVVSRKSFCRPEAPPMVPDVLNEPGVVVRVYPMSAG